MQTGYVFVIAPFHKGEGTYDEYRQFRSMMLHTYCLAFFREQRRLHTVVGLAFDIYTDSGEIKTRSEDLITMDAPDWTPEFLTDLERARAHFGLKDPRELEVGFRKGKIRNPFRAQSWRR